VRGNDRAEHFHSEALIIFVKFNSGNTNLIVARDNQTRSTCEKSREI